MPVGTPKVEKDVPVKPGLLDENIHLFRYCPVQKPSNLIYRLKLLGIAHDLNYLLVVKKTLKSCTRNACRNITGWSVHRISFAV